MKIRRAALLLTLALGIFVVPLAADAQAVPRIALLSPFQQVPLEIRMRNAFEQALREHGYVVGQTITVLYRYSNGHDEQLPKLAAELVQLKVDALLTVGSPATRAAQQATKTLPIVMVTVLDPVAAGFVRSLSKPGGNITGSSEMAEELVGKRVELLKAAVPRASRIAVLWDPSHPTNALDLKRTQIAAGTLGVRVLPVAGYGPDGNENAFAQMTKQQAQALIVLTTPAALVKLEQIVGLAIRNRLPTMWGYREGAEGGALMAYGPNIAEQYRRAARYVDKILKGAKPSELPVEQPMKFELVINLTTAKALGLTIPQSVLLRADEVIK